MPNFTRFAKAAQMTLVAAGYSGTATIPTDTLATLITARQIAALRLTGLSTVSDTNTIVNLVSHPVARTPRRTAQADNP
jgi:hypothetical protein